MNQLSLNIKKYIIKEYLLIVNINFYIEFFIKSIIVEDIYITQLII